MLPFPLVILTVATDTLTLHISDWDAVDEVEGQLAVRVDIVVALVKEHRHAAAGLATVLDDPLGQHLYIFAMYAPSALKEGADAAKGGE